MLIVLALLAMFSLTFLIKEADGPFGVCAWMRNKLIGNKYVGVFFYKLLNCWYCTGFHSGWIVYMLYADHFVWQSFVINALAGAATSLILGSLYEFINRE